ncbi:adenosylmethionine decarboxylase [Candidatus Bipolaricaulota sp. J31]
MKALGRHLVVEMWGCKANLNEPERIREALAEAVERAQATNLGVHVHSFNPHGVSGVAVIAESHISIHTWPELGYVALDVFTCGDKAIPEAALEVLKDLFRPQHMEVLEIKRGLRPE